MLGAYRDEGTLINWDVLCDEGRVGSRLRLRINEALRRKATVYAR